MREHNVICDNCHIEICLGNIFIAVGTMEQHGFELRYVFPGDDAHFCTKKCLCDYLDGARIDPTSPLASCCSTHAEGYDECK
jgi:hypothetical protein